MSTVESAPGAGTTFRIFFPITERRVQPQPIPAASAPAEGTILVVADEEIVRKMAQTALKRLGYRIVTANNREEALRI
jgi:two-component system, cell cycle sensor histidine kinase and response regulator CckA